MALRGVLNLLLLLLLLLSLVLAEPGCALARRGGVARARRRRVATAAWRGAPTAALLHERSFSLKRSPRPWGEAGPTAEGQIGGQVARKKLLRTRQQQQQKTGEGRLPLRIPAGEVRALQDLARLFPFGQLSGWGEPWDCLRAEGLQCDAQGSVVSLSMTFVPLSGEVPPSIGALAQLQYLDLGVNFLTGEIPQSIFNLTMLTFLSLRENLLTGELPGSLSSLVQLQHLDIMYNNLSGLIPDSMGSLTALTLLSLGYNSFTGSLPDIFREMENLRRLVVDGNALGGSPPDSIWRLRKLTRLHLFGNNFTGTITSASLANLTGLQNLDLGYNSNLTLGPGGVARLTSLTSLALNTLDLSSHSDILGNLPASLIRVSLRSCGLTGRLPDDLTRLRNLSYLILSYNQFSGGLPRSWSSLQSLGYVALKNSGLAGPLSSFVALRSMPSLFSLGLSGNSLTGPIPRWLSELTNLRSLFLGRNKESSGMDTPSSVLNPLSKLAALWRLELQEWGLTGNVSFPSSWTGIIQLNLSGNHIQAIGPSLGSLTGLTSLDVSENRLQELPGPVGQLLYLEFLSLAGNRLETSADKLCDSLVQLLHLDLSASRLQGVVPDCLSRLTRLTFLSLRGNNITGSLPEIFGALSSLAELAVDGQAITGSAPSSLVLLTGLSVLQLPDTLPCPRGPCTAENAVKNSAFCSRCSAFCSACPIPSSAASSAALLQFQQQAEAPGWWTEDSFDGVTFQSGNVSAISIQGTYFRRKELSSSGFGSNISPLGSRAIFDAVLPFRQSLTRLVLDAMGITAPYPPTLGQLQELQHLDLAYNNLGGEVPKEWATLTAMTHLDLAAQVMHGAGPTGASRLASMASLRFLSLSYSGFAEPFPAPLTALRHIRSLDLSGNNFSGSIPREMSQLRHLTSLNLRGNLLLSGALPLGLAALPLSLLLLDSPECPTCSRCPSLPVNSSNPFCAQYCPHCCSPCYPPPPPPSPPRPPPPLPPPPSPPPPPPPSPPSGLSPAGVAAIAAGCAAVAMAFIVTVLCIGRSWKAAREEAQSSAVRRFSMAELERATGNFSQLLGKGGGGTVFKGVLESGEEVAVKRSNAKVSEISDSEFRNEIKLMSSVRHKNLVALVGYCLHSEQLLLVYEFMHRGSLQGLLRKEPETLTWRMRLELAFGAALGLDYLHSQINPPIVHMDIKTDNILVTLDYQAKVADFGISEERAGNGGLAKSNEVKGTRGYMDPDYMATGSSSTKSDVYAFGIILLELATGWRAIEDYEHILTRVVRGIRGSQGPLGLMAPCIRSELEHQGNEQSLSVPIFQSFVSLAVKCCLKDAKLRPSMYVVANTLECIIGGKTEQGDGEESLLTQLADSAGFSRAREAPSTATELLRVGDTFVTEIEVVDDQP